MKQLEVARRWTELGYQALIDEKKAEAFKQYSPSGWVGSKDFGTVYFDQGLATEARNKENVSSNVSRLIQIINTYTEEEKQAMCSAINSVLGKKIETPIVVEDFQDTQKLYATLVNAIAGTYTHSPDKFKAFFEDLKRPDAGLPHDHPVQTLEHLLLTAFYDNSANYYIEDRAERALAGHVFFYCRALNKNFTDLSNEVGSHPELFKLIEDLYKVMSDVRDKMTLKWYHVPIGCDLFWERSQKESDEAWQRKVESGEVDREYEEKFGRKRPKEDDVPRIVTASSVIENAANAAGDYGLENKAAALSAVERLLGQGIEDEKIQKQIIAYQYYTSDKSSAGFMKAALKALNDMERNEKARREPGPKDNWENRMPSGQRGSFSK